MCIDDQTDCRPTTTLIAVDEKWMPTRRRYCSRHNRRRLRYHRHHLVHHTTSKVLVNVFDYSLRSDIILIFFWDPDQH